MREGEGGGGCLTFFSQYSLMGSYSLKPVQLVSIDTMLRQRLRATKHRGATTVHSSVIGPTLHLLCVGDKIYTRCRIEPKRSDTRRQRSPKGNETRRRARGPLFLNGLNLMAHVSRWVIGSCWVIGSLNLTWVDWVNWVIGSRWVIKIELGHWVS